MSENTFYLTVDCQSQTALFILTLILFSVNTPGTPTASFPDVLGTNSLPESLIF